MLIRITFLLSIFIFPLFVNSSINPEVDQKWKSEINTLRIGLLGGENEADRVKNYECWRLYLEDNLKIPVKRIRNIQNIKINLLGNVSSLEI